MKGINRACPNNFKRCISAVDYLAGEKNAKICPEYLDGLAMTYAGVELI